MSDDRMETLAQRVAREARERRDRVVAEHGYEPVERTDWMNTGAPFCPRCGYPDALDAPENQSPLAAARPPAGDREHGCPKCGNNLWVVCASGACDFTTPIAALPRRTAASAGEDERAWAIQRIEESRAIHLAWVAHLGGPPCDRCQQSYAVNDCPRCAPTPPAGATGEARGDPRSEGGYLLRSDDVRPPMPIEARELALIEAAKATCYLCAGYAEESPLQDGGHWREPFPAEQLAGTITRVFEVCAAARIWDLLGAPSASPARDGGTA
jgi:hypothetical protein